MQPRTRQYDTFSLAKGGWKAKKLTKRLTIDPSGEMNILWETEDEKEQYFLSEVHQIICSDISQTSNPMVTFVFKDERKQPSVELQFEQEESCKEFLQYA
jgi:hypothetical protein